MPELKLNRNKVEVLIVDIDGKKHSVPLGTSLKRKELLKLKTQEAADKFFETHLGKELWNDLTVGEQREITKAWSDATQQASGGTTLGES